LPAVATGRESATTNPAADIARIQREQQYFAAISQVATVAETVRQKENEITIARMQGIPITAQQAETMKRLAMEQALGISQTRAAIDAKNIEAATFDMTAGAAARYTVIQNALNAARDRGEKLTPAYVAAIEREAAALGAATDRMKALSDRRESIDFLRDETKALFADVRSAQAEGVKGWAAWADAAEKALSRVLTKLSEMLMNDAFAAIGGSKTGGISSFLSGLFGGGAAAGSVGAGIGGSAYSIGFGGQMVPVFHTGRYPGAPRPAYRFDDPSLYAAAPRFHSGRTPPALAPGELRAIIKDDELVVPRNKVSQGGDAGGDTFNVSLAVDASGQSDPQSIGQMFMGFIRSQPFKQAVKDAVREGRSRREGI
jgi:hypothetical protein